VLTPIAEKAARRPVGEAHGQEQSRSPGKLDGQPDPRPHGGDLPRSRECLPAQIQAVSRDHRRAASDTEVSESRIAMQGSEVVSAR
jgi:hypothetical protein